MKARCVSVERMRRADREATARYGIPSVFLMENAGAACARVLAGFAMRGSRVLVLAGEGNNGGDAYTAARHLHIAGYRVRVLYTKKPAQDKVDALIQRAILLKMGVPVRVARTGGELRAAFAGSGWIVDGLYGTGSTRPASGVSAELIRRTNASGRPVLSIDIPSGLDAMSGRPHAEAVRAKITVTLAAAKPGLMKPSARDHVGRLIVADIGLPTELLK